MGFWFKLITVTYSGYYLLVKILLNEWNSGPKKKFPNSTFNTQHLKLIITFAPSK